MTFDKDIAPITLTRCAPCHRASEPTPFPLVTYADVRQRARLIAAVTASRIMPPWKPDAGYGEFVGARALSPAQIQLIQQWVEQGAPEGDARDLPPTPVWPTNWQLGEPDLVVEMSEPYQLSASGPDLLRTFVIPIPVSRRRFVRGLEFRAGSTPVVHHATMRIDPTRGSRWLDDQDPLPGYDGPLALDARYPQGHFLGWTPGQLRPLEEDGFGWRLDPGSDLVLQLHLVPSGRPESIRARIALFFTDTPPSHLPSIIRLTRQDIDIPAGEYRYVAEDSYKLPVDVELREVQPHAHLLARRIEGTAELPDGTTRPLIRISDWDFRWQDVYRLKQPMRLPAGTTLRMRIEYDNSSDNPRNPFTPSRRVRLGEKTTDEMAVLFLQVLPRSRDDLEALELDTTRKSIAEDVVQYQHMIEIEPDNAALHADLAQAYLQVGRGADAIAQLEVSVRLDPQSTMGRYNLGGAFAFLGRPDRAIPYFEEAIRLKPDLALAHGSLADALQRIGKLEDSIREYRVAIALDPEVARTANNLGLALQAVGRLEEAVAQYERAAQLLPDDPMPERNWAKALAVQGKGGEAVAHLRAALKSAPNSPACLGELAWVLATHPAESIRAPKEALGLAERGAAATQFQDPRLLDILASSYAAAGEFVKAVSTGRSAIKIATEQKLDRLAAAISDRLRLYEMQRPYVHDFSAGFGEGQ